MITDKIIKLEDMVTRNLKSIAPNLSVFYSENKVVELLQQGENIAEFLLQERMSIEKTYRQDVENQKKNAMLEAEVIKRKAHEEGMAQGKEEIIRKFDDFIKYIDKSKENIEMETSRIYAQQEQDLAALSLKIAEKLVLSEMEFNEELLTRIIKNIISQITERKKVTIKANPQDYEILVQHADEIKKEGGMISEFSIEKNNAVSRGGVIFEMSSGLTDAQIETQVRKIREAFFNEQG
ncbi:MAG: FliH/SctL family protein [Candidatus Margulisbacteria bacterium]|nr:FliH/SctL family protein [Candidatus Margulisiibacteriota bacterium]